MKIENRFKDSLVECRNNITKKGKAIEANIDPNETYLEIRKTTKKIQKENNAA